MEILQKCKIYFKNLLHLIQKRKIQNFEKAACQKVVAMVTSNLIDKVMLYRMVPR